MRGALTPLDVALATLLCGLEPLTAVELPLREALGCITAELPPLKAFPPFTVGLTRYRPLRVDDLRSVAPEGGWPHIQRSCWPSLD